MAEQGTVVAHGLDEEYTDDAENDSDFGLIPDIPEDKMPPIESANEILNDDDEYEYDDGDEFETYDEEETSHDETAGSLPLPPPGTFSYGLKQPEMMNLGQSGPGPAVPAQPMGQYQNQGQQMNMNFRGGRPGYPIPQVPPSGYFQQYPAQSNFPQPFFNPYVSNFYQPNPYQQFQPQFNPFAMQMNQRQFYQRPQGPPNYGPQPQYPKNSPVVEDESNNVSSPVVSPVVKTPVSTLRQSMTSPQSGRFSPTRMVVLEEQASRAVDELKIITKKNKELKLQVMELSSSLEAEKKRSDKEKEELMSRYSNAEEKATGVSGTMHEYKRKIESLEKAKELLEQKLDSALSRAKKGESSSTSASEEVEALQGKLSDMQVDLKNREDTVQKLQDRLVVLQQTVEKLERDLDIVKREKDRLGNQLQDAQGNSASLRNDLQLIQQAKQTSEANLRDFQSDVSSLKKERDALSARNLHLENKLESLSANHREEMAHNSALTATTKQQELHIQRLAREIQIGNAEIANLRRRRDQQSNLPTQVNDDSDRVSPSRYIRQPFAVQEVSQKAEMVSPAKYTPRQPFALHEPSPEPVGRSPEMVRQPYRQPYIEEYHEPEPRQAEQVVVDRSAEIEEKVFREVREVMREERLKNEAILTTERKEMEKDWLRLKREYDEKVREMEIALSPPQKPRSSDREVQAEVHESIPSQRFERSPPRVAVEQEIARARQRVMAERKRKQPEMTPTADQLAGKDVSKSGLSIAQIALPSGYNPEDPFLQKMAAHVYEQEQHSKKEKEMEERLRQINSTDEYERRAAERREHMELLIGREKEDLERKRKEALKKREAPPMAVTSEPWRPERINRMPTPPPAMKPSPGKKEKAGHIPFALDNALMTEDVEKIVAHLEKDLMNTQLELDKREGELNRFEEAPCRTKREKLKKQFLENHVLELSQKAQTLKLQLREYDVLY